MNVSDDELNNNFVFNNEHSKAAPIDRMFLQALEDKKDYDTFKDDYLNIGEVV